MALKWTRRGRIEAAPGNEPGAADALVDELIVLADLATGPAVALQVRRVLTLAGIEEVAPELGTVFDPELHHVVQTVETTEHGAGEIVEVVRPGWRRAGVLLRPVEVAVAARPGVFGPS